MKKNYNTIKTNFNKKIEIHFDGGRITSDTGLILHREFEKKIEFMEMIKRYVKFRKRGTIHDDESCIRQEVYSFIAGYEDNIDANHLRCDPTLQNVVGKEELASQPTLSRFENRYDMTDVWQFQRGNWAVVDKVESVEKIKEIFLDVDMTDVPTHGKQEGGRNHGFYNDHIRQIMLCFNDKGSCVKGSLRRGTANPSPRVINFMKEPIYRYLEKGVKVKVRGDIAIGSPEFYEFCEKRGIEYFIGFSTNSVLESLIKENKSLWQEDKENPGVFFGEVQYKATRWKKERRICFKIKTPEGQLFPEIRCILTDSVEPAEKVISIYNERGTCENYIKEGKLGFFWTRLGLHKFSASAFRLQIMILAYNFNNLLRHFCMPDILKNSHIQTIRTKLIKIGSRLVKRGRKLIFRCAESYPYYDIFYTTWRNILNFSFPPKVDSPLVEKTV